MRALISENRQKEKLNGKISAILLVIHDGKCSDEVMRIRHENKGIAKTHIHEHIRGDKCLDIFVLEGDAGKIKKIHSKFQKEKRIGLSKLFIA